MDKQLLLTKQQQVRTDNERIHVRRENNTFILMITNASLEDIGYYACRVSGIRAPMQLNPCTFTSTTVDTFLLFFCLYLDKLTPSKISSGLSRCPGYVLNAWQMSINFPSSLFSLVSRAPLSLLLSSTYTCLSLSLSQCLPTL